MAETGTKAALDTAVATYEPPAEEEQLDLLGLPEPATEAGRKLIETKRGPGRPPGARNKRTQRTVDWLLSVYQDPRAVLLAIAQAPADELAARLGCTPMEALQEKRLAAAAVLPYVAQRQPLAVDLNTKSVVYLTINDTPNQAPDSAGVELTARIVEDVEFQRVSEGDQAGLGQHRLGQKPQRGGKPDDASD